VDGFVRGEQPAECRVARDIGVADLLVPLAQPTLCVVGELAGRQGLETDGHLREVLLPQAMV
jgi:hypothetical protein